MQVERAKTPPPERRTGRYEPKDAILRQWVMLQMIPREPSGITTQELRKKLAMADSVYDVHKRTIERNLQQLMSIFPSLNYREQRSGNFWYWERDTVMDVPRLDAKTALMFRLARDYLTPVLPRATLNELNPHFKQADKTLREVGERSYSRWPDKIRMIQNSIQLKHPEVNQSILATVYDALFEERKIAIAYRIRNGDERQYQVNLLGMVFRDGVIYAVCTLDGKENIRQMPLHRILQAKLMNEAIECPPHFDLDHYVRTYFDYPLRELQVNASHRDGIQEKIRVTLALDPVSAVHLQESPLAEDQVIQALPDGRITFTATVNNTERLRWWILSYGPYMEIMAPEDLRKEIGKKIRQASRIYHPTEDVLSS